ncbi:MAG: TRAP transporter substrate-binding protein, partial [Tissierellales bacterium]|nr:TRAP transporter substrate-binding protein [Tissierellales bacterium]
MRNKKVVSIVAIMMAMMMLFAGCSKPVETTTGSGQTTAAPKVEVIEMNLGHSGPLTHHYHISAEKFVEIVAEKTNGAIKINIFPADQLGAGPEELESVMLGTQDLVITPDAFIASHDPMFNVMGMPYQITSYEQVEKFMESEVARKLEDRAKEKNIVILGWLANGFRLVTTNKAIETPEDMKGLKLRIGSAKLIADLLTTLGANPTPISMSETYTALQTKTVDGQENPTTNILQNKLFEVQSHLAITRHQYVAQPLVINKDKFDSLSPEFQQILLEAGKEVAKMDVKMVQDSEADQLKELEAAGMTITYPDQTAFREVLEPLYESYASQYGAEWAELIDLMK